ncbi:MAG TPA: hypothetical protein VKH45_00090 [Candidatus Acidoferrum sp.]|nr:hypothetical protein [Candidatus Acidoferrum sp.]
MTKKWLSVATAGILLLCARSNFAQNRAAPPTQNLSSAEAYEVSRELTLVGTVLSFAPSSLSAPLGPRLRLETPSGIVDVHLGDARTLATSHFTLQTGDTVRIIGETVSLPNHTTQFLARILQKGTETLVVRTPHGFPIPPTIPAQARDGQKQGGVM